MSTSETHYPWGSPVWGVDFRAPQRALPASVNFAVIGAGFTGLAAAARLRMLARDKSVAVFEAATVGSGASGRTGGMVLAGSAADDLPGLGDVLSGLQEILKELRVDCDLSLPGAWEIAHRETNSESQGAGKRRSPIQWNDPGPLRVVDEVPGGSLDPGKLVSGLGRAADRLGVAIFENQPVQNVEWSGRAELHLPKARVRAEHVLFATNGLSLPLSGLAASTHPALTLAAATAPLSDEQIGALGLAERKPFYTVDFPYLWGRMRGDNSIVWGAGLVSEPGLQDLTRIDTTSEAPAHIFASLEKRVHGLHPTLASAKFTHRWGGPILFREGWQPVFTTHQASPRGIVLGAYAGHGVALSVYLGTWAAEVLLGRREPPEWGRIDAA
jgi:glycine/D-amino acid oxidase-like deaminating enzyme